MVSNFDIALGSGITETAEYIPTAWSDQIIAAYKSNLVLAGLVSTLDYVGEKGGTIKIPTFTAFMAATAKSEDVTLVPVHPTDTTTTVLIDKHYYVAFLREDRADIQAINSWRASFADRAGYGLAVQVDTDLRNLAATWNSGTTYSGAFIGSDGSTAYDWTVNGNAAAFTDAGLRRAIQRLDDGDVPFVDRYLLVPPVEKRRLLDIPKLVEQAFVGESGDANSIRNGLVGDIYGVKVYMSTNVAEIESSTSVAARVCLLFQRQSLALAMQKEVRMQEQYKLEALGTLVATDVLYGVKTIREAGCDAYVVPSA